MFLGRMDKKVQVSEKLETCPASILDFVGMRILILEVFKNFGQFKLNDEDREFYSKNFSLIFDHNLFEKSVNVETIRFFLNL